MNTDQLFSKLTISLHATMLSKSNLLIHVPNTAHHIYYHTQDYIQQVHTTFDTLTASSGNGIYIS